MSKSLAEIRVGDQVCRHLAGSIAMPLLVTDIQGNRIHCGPWIFSRANGAEIDPELGWDEQRAGSYIRADECS